RTFFRRCIVLGQAYICSNGGRCPRFSVRTCRACRFDRCIMAGMNVTAIHLPSSTDRAAVQRAIDQRRKEILRSDHFNPFC
ncbi:zinc finger protein, partial [Aphelenchoides avenae]